MSWRFWLSDKTVRTFEELQVPIYCYCQRQNCSPGILLSSNVRYMWIFAGVCKRGVSNESGVIVSGDFRFFRLLYLPNLHIEGHNYYIVPCSPLVALHWHRNGWPWMTLNGHVEFCVKIWFELGIQWVGVLAFGKKTVRKFAELRIYC